MHSASDLLSQAIALHKAGQLKEAEAVYQTLLAAQPDHAVVLNLLGTLRFQQGRWQEGIPLMDKAIAAKPDYAEAHYDRALALMKLGEFTEAVTGYDNAIAIKPDFADAHSNRGNALQELNQYDEALASYEKAIALKPSFANNYTNQGKALHELQRYDEALVSYDKAIALNPDEPKTYLNKAFLKLLHAKFEEGWELYEWRWKKHRQDEYTLAHKPLWRGEQSLTGKTILLHAEQGLGDTIQCCRYVRKVQALGAKIILKVPVSLGELMSTLQGSFRLVTAEEPVGDFDFHCPLFSLPLAFKTRLHTIPADIPYLIADPVRQKMWQERLGKKTKPRIGLVWSGSVANTKDRNRTIALPLLLPQLQSTYEWHALQKEIKPQDEALLKRHGQIVLHADSLKDFADTAALIAEMDLVLSIDTSVAHLAGALGKPVWILLPFVPDFRWMEGREDSPWYPSARLFRQTDIGDWKSVIAQMTAALESTYK